MRFWQQIFLSMKCTFQMYMLAKSFDINLIFLTKRLPSSAASELTDMTQQSYPPSELRNRKWPERENYGYPQDKKTN
ncbi:hypothetical protein A3737_27770 [Oleiphilus sp. HI0065]|nr:hypothetical protein A3737_27770 [Oleiphilus sp. HI0065]